jgi:hypothetical protein
MPYMDYSFNNLVIRFQAVRICLGIKALIYCVGWNNLVSLPPRKEAMICGLLFEISDLECF